MSASIYLLVAALASAPNLQPEVRNVRISSPRILLSREKSGSDVQIAGQFKVEMFFAKPVAKKPVAKVVTLCEVNGALVMNCILLDKPNATTPMSVSEVMSAVSKAGIKVDYKEKEKYYADPATFTPYLQEVGKDAYTSALYGTSELGRGFVRLGKSEKMPRLLVYRIEIWQNGKMLTKFDSSRTGLGAHGIPSDWHEWRKYPQKFKYADVR